MGAVIKGRFKKPVSRVIGSSLQRAAQDYECSKCICPIFAGEEYIRDVHLHKGYDLYGFWVTYVTVQRLHLHCPDDEHECWLEKDLGDEMDTAETDKHTQVA